MKVPLSRLNIKSNLTQIYFESIFCIIELQRNSITRCNLPNVWVNDWRGLKYKVTVPEYKCIKIHSNK